MEGPEDAWPRFYYFCIPTVVQSILFSNIDIILPLDIIYSAEQS